jgi:ribosome-binding protein aMBF1 (putative translation factor)
MKTPLNDKEANVGLSDSNAGLGHKATHWCSFCGKSNTDSKHIIVGESGSCICSDCVEFCRDIVGQYRMSSGNGVVESRDSEQIGQTGSAQAKPENSDMDSVCHDIAPSPNVCS